MSFPLAMVLRQETEGLLSHLDDFIEKLNEVCDSVEVGSDLWRDMIIITGLAVRCESAIDEIIANPASTIVREVFKHKGSREKHDE